MKIESNSRDLSNAITLNIPMSTYSFYDLEIPLVDSKQATYFSLYVLSRDKTPAEYYQALLEFADYSQRLDELNKLQAMVDKLEQISKNKDHEFTSLDERILYMEELALYKDKLTLDGIWDLRHGRTKDEYIDALENIFIDHVYEYVLDEYGAISFSDGQERINFLRHSMQSLGYDVSIVDKYRRPYLQMVILEEMARAHDYTTATGNNFYKHSTPNFIYIPFMLN